MERRNKNRIPKAIYNMILRSYTNGENTAQSARRISNTKLAKKLGVKLSQQRVAAYYLHFSLGNIRSEE